MEPLFHHSLIPVYSTGQSDWTTDGLPSHAFVIDGRGWKIWKRSQMANSVVETRQVDGLPELKESCHPNFYKIPAPLFQSVEAFFRAVWKRSRTEAAGILLYRTADHSWDFAVPPQTASGGGVHYDVVDEKGVNFLQPWLSQGYVEAGTIHSHGSMGAFHSGTDKDDEATVEGVHITIGKVDERVAEYACAVVVSGQRITYDDIAGLVDIPSASAAPADWMAAVKDKVPWEAEGNSPDPRFVQLYDDYFDGVIDQQEYEKELSALRAVKSASMPPSGVIVVDGQRFETMSQVNEAINKGGKKGKKNTPVPSNEFGFFDIRRYTRR